MPPHVLSCRSHTPSPAPDAAQTQQDLHPDMKLPWCEGLLICTHDLWCCVAPDLAPTPPLSRTASCPWSLHHCLHPQIVPAGHGPLPMLHCKARKNFLHRLGCWSVRTRHLKLVLVHLIWFISGFRRSINDCTFLLWCFCLNLSINTPPSHCSTKIRG